VSRTRRTAAGLLAVALLAGCSATGGEPDVAPASGTAAAPTGAGDVHASLPPAGESPVWDARATATARTAATAALETWLREDLPAEDWFRELLPHLTGTAQEAYAYTDPAAVPGEELGRQNMVQQGASPYLATVALETDAGYYVLDLQRLDGGSPWLVDRIHLPEKERGADG
jgi:hypothetical protein